MIPCDFYDKLYNEQCKIVDPTFVANSVINKDEAIASLKYIRDNYREVTKYFKSMTSFDNNIYIINSNKETFTDIQKFTTQCNLMICMLEGIDIMLRPKIGIDNYFWDIIYQHQAYVSKEFVNNLANRLIERFDITVHVDYINSFIENIRVRYNIINIGHETILHCNGHNFYVNIFVYTHKPEYIFINYCHSHNRAMYNGKDFLCMPSYLFSMVTHVVNGPYISNYHKNFAWLCNEDSSILYKEDGLEVKKFTI